MSVTDEIIRLNNNKDTMSIAHTNIANAITAKGGTLSQNSGFDTFADDIATIPNVDDFITGNMTNLTSLVQRLPNFALSYRQDLKTLSLPNLTGAGTRCCYQCSSLETAYLPKLTKALHIWSLHAHV